jgi:uncharacterized protein (TIGR03067 family)
MTRKLILLIVPLALLIALVVYLVYPWDNAAAQRTALAAKHLAPLQGRWVAMVQTDDGPPIPTGATYTIQDNIITCTLKPGSTGAPAYYYVIDALDPSHDPPWIDWTVYNRNRNPAGQEIAFRQQGVYRLDRDSLTIRLSRAGESRPSKAAIEPGQNGTIFILKRVADQPP